MKQKTCFSRPIPYETLANPMLLREIYGYFVYTSIFAKAVKKPPPAKIPVLFQDKAFIKNSIQCGVTKRKHPLLPIGYYNF